MGMTIVRAHAKINLCLALGPAEPPGSERAGWHRIATWMHTVDLADEVGVEPARGPSTLSVAWAPDAVRPTPVDWTPDKDLGWRALRALEREAGRSLPTRLVVTKRIPTGAGLGGGSSDAGAVLRAVNGAWALGLGTERLRAIGATLGSDVAFFAGASRAALVRGFGEIVEERAAVRAGVVLVAPAFSCPTRGVYQAFDALGPGVMRGVEVERAMGRAIASGRVEGGEGGELFNDLAPAAERVRPALAGLRAGLAAGLGEPVHVTGSGSALFLLCDEGEAGSLAARAGELAGRLLPGTRVLASRLA